MQAFRIQGLVDVMTGNALTTLRELDTRAQASARTLGTVTDAAGRTRDAMGRFVGGAQSATLSMGGLEKVLSNVLKRMAAYAGLRQIFSVFASGATETLKFEAAMRNVNTVAFMTEAQLAATSEKVRDLATSLKVSASPVESATALYDIMSSGFTDTSKAMEVLSASLIAGSAGLTTTQTAAKAVTAVMNAYGQETMTAAHVSDVMFKAVQVGVVTFEEFAQHIGNVVSIAATTGISFEELSGTIAALTVKGIRAPIAIDSIRAALSQLMAPSQAAKDEMEQYGIKIDASTLKSKGLVRTLIDLTNATGGNEAALKHILNDINAVNVAMALTKDGGKAAMDAVRDASDAAGSSMAALRQQNESTEKQWQNFIASLKAFGVALFTDALPYLKTLIEYLQTSLDFFANFGKKLDELAAEDGPLGAFARGLKAAKDGVNALHDAMVGWGIIGVSSTEGITESQKQLNAWLLKNKTLLDNARNKDGVPTSGNLARGATTKELSQSISGARWELANVQTEQTAAADIRARRKVQMDLAKEGGLGPQGQFARAELAKIDVEEKEKGIDSSDVAFVNRQRRIDQMKETLELTQEAVTQTREYDAEKMRTDKQIEDLEAKYGETGAARMKREYDNAKMIQDGERRWKIQKEKMRKEGDDNKPEALENLRTFRSSQTFGVKDMREMHERAVKLEREIGEDRVKIAEKANVEIAKSNLTVLKSWHTYATQQLDMAKANGTATIADQERVSSAVKAEAGAERLAKLAEIEKSEADLKRKGNDTVDAQRGFAAQRVAIEADYNDRIRVEALRRLQEEKAEEQARIAFKVTLIQETQQLNDVEVSRLETLEGRGFNVEAQMQVAQQRRLQLMIDGLHAQEVAERASAKTAEDVARIRMKYANDENIMRVKFAEDEKERQRRFADQQRQMHESLADEIFKMTHTEKEAEVYDLQRKVEELRRNGFSEIEIAQYVAAKKLDLLKKEKDAIDGVTSAMKDQTDVMKGPQSLDEMVKEQNARFSLGAFGAVNAANGGASTGSLADLFAKAGLAGPAATMGTFGGGAKGWNGIAGAINPSSPTSAPGGGYTGGTAGPGYNGPGPWASNDYSAQIVLDENGNRVLKSHIPAGAKTTAAGATYYPPGVGNNPALPANAVRTQSGSTYYPPGVGAAGAAPNVAGVAGGYGGAGAGLSSSGGVLLSGQKVDLSITIDGEVRSNGGTLTQKTIDGLVDDLGIRSHLGGDRPGKLGRSQ